MPTGQRKHAAAMHAVALAIALVVMTLPAAVSSARAAPTPAPAPSEWITVRLPAHIYGRLSGPDAVVATAGPRWFTFTPGHQGATVGPNTFDVAPDGSVWVAGTTFVVWSPDAPRSPRAVPLPAPAINDFGLAVDGTVYVTSGYGGPELLYALSATGRVLWTAPYAGDSALAPLRIGADTVVYVEASSSGRADWRPLTTIGGDPLPTQQQRSGTASGLPVAGGRRLADLSGSAGERRYVLLDHTGVALTRWQLISAGDDLATVGTPTLIGDDLVVTVALSRNESGRFRYEFETLRLTPSGRVAAAVTTSARSVWGDPLTSVRIGANGALYQLETSPTTGVRVVRYALDGHALDGAGSTSSIPPAGSRTGPTGSSRSAATPPAAAPSPPARAGSTVQACRSRLRSRRSAR
ncbi:MAG TPA: hypothetical protein VHN80_02190 [Kineosporiaceae bacterium]|nr:hypothetical protein [Kineosporiaceae bacterium]